MISNSPILENSRLGAKLYWPWPHDSCDSVDGLQARAALHDATIGKNRGGCDVAGTVAS
jgi:hypothetical protein